VADLVLAEHRADLRPVGVDERRDREASVAEPAVVGEGGTQVADADDDDRPVLGETQLAAHLVEQELDVVAHASGAVGTQVRQVLADLGGVDPGHLGQALRRDRGGLLGVEVHEGPQVDGQPGHRGLGDTSPGAVHTPTLPTTFIRSQSHEGRPNRATRQCESADPAPRGERPTLSP
jgi:hypothetical protein